VRPAQGARGEAEGVGEGDGVADSEDVEDGDAGAEGLKDEDGDNDMVGDIDVEGLGETHKVQFADPARLQRPAAQGVQEVARAALKVPGPHWRQLDRPATAAKVPAVQPVQAHPSAPEKPAEQS
jgi:hypothetical protein